MSTRTQGVGCGRSPGARLARRPAAHRWDGWGIPYGTGPHEEIAPVVGELTADPDAVTRALDKLGEWGNLRADPDHARVTAVEDFCRRRFIYQLTRAGAAAEAALGSTTRCWGGAANRRRSRCTTSSPGCGRSW
ncbi:DUF2397 family protein [Streptomyces sp. NPDC053780]|uniref:DUF2397 family protein n=1 Tax=unclassified Streptomyces TaxID=2593676 RepID=UPI0034446F81